ncbi:MAG: hypothetical protein WC544_05100 [Patescibacteria group bacterium]
MGRGLYLLITWPGVVAHEASHLVACLLTFTKVTRVSFFHPQGETLGFVEHERTHNPLKKVFISAAPLIGVSVVLWLIVRWLWPDAYLVQLQSLHVATVDFSSFQHFFSFSSEYFRGMVHNVQNFLQAFQGDQWQTYVGIYLLIGLGSHAAPSREDLKQTFGGLAGLAVIFAIAYGLDQWLQIPLTWDMMKVLSYPVYLLTYFLSLGIIFAIVGIIPWLVIGGIARLAGKGRPLNTV